MPVFLFLFRQPAPQAANAQPVCTGIQSEKEIPSPALINFEEFPNGQLIGTSYAPAYGVTFENSSITRAFIYGNEPAKARSSPNVATNDAVSPQTSSGVPMKIVFDALKTHVGFYIGNGNGQIAARMVAYDNQNNALCETRAVVPDAHTQFIGITDPEGRIKSITLDYGETILSEAIDDLYFAPAKGSPRRPAPTWTPVPTAKPTPGPTATPTPVLPMYAYLPVKNITSQIFLNQDVSIHGIEITQGIQCFDTSKGLGSCPDNSLPVAAKKDTTARIYLKAGGIFSTLNNVPVRLYIRANNVWYTANASGTARTSINQGNPDSANIYFNVNFSNDVLVDFYAVVDPDNTITETNESNNRYPAAGYITLNFRKRETLKIVGQRLRYHPTGYSGSQYAGGWAVNGGGADWLEQILPIRNNGINYSVKSGYLDWTSDLGSGDNQHALIRMLNFNWILENAFSWLFGTGAFTAADHVYGWAPSAGYSGGHADMPIYPHAGGLGVVGIGSDNPGTNTDNPGSGALIFGHELVHDYNVYHTNTSDACGSNDSNSDFPYSNSSIQEFGFNPITGKIYDPATTHDLMSYCPSGGSRQGWISPFTWNKMFNKLTPGAALANLSVAPGAPTGVYAVTENMESLVVNAIIFNPLYKPTSMGNLGNLYRVSGGLSYALPEGDYSVQLRDAVDTILYSQSFVVNFESEYDAHNEGTLGPSSAPPFPPDPTHQVDVSFIIPWAEGTTSIALLYKDQVIDLRKVSLSPPVVNITAPSQPVAWPLGSTQTLSWTGSDPDGDPLAYSVFYSNDAGAHWVILAEDLKDLSLELPIDSLAGGSDVRFRVVATDGVNTGNDETDALITVPNHPPLVTIFGPVGGSTFLPGELVVLQGSATDLEDGSLPDDTLQWSSDRQGGLGTGPSLPVNTLEPGLHVISLSSIDSYGIHASATTTIYIGSRAYLPLLSR